MQKRVRSSLSVKVFCWVFAALAICSMLIYGMVLTVLPKQYQLIVDKQLDENTEILISKLQNMEYDDAIKEIYLFCIQNNVTAILSDDNGALSFGEIKAEAATVTTSVIVTDVSFLDSETEYMFIISSLSQTADRISGLMFHFLPVVFVIIILLSMLSAFICSKVIVAPIAEISRIAKQMTSFDMTWNCDIESHDEIGVLAFSLNTMAGRLQTTMEQRRNFFAAVSHELKTPLTILKGQIENMMLGYGDYQNHEKYLPEALEAVEEIEQLVKEIISISKMESMDLQNTLQDVSLWNSINSTIETLLPLAKEKEIQIQQHREEDVILSVNSNLWNKALSNIIGNGVRHSPCGESVLLSLEQQENRKVLVVENTGVFIPEDDFPNLFTPFYRADKSRSKATGGSGLGLYIVKTILDLHGMAYSIKNTQKGVAFFLYLT